MIRPFSKNSVISEYEIEAYCRLYSASVNENCEYGDFLKLCDNAAKECNPKAGSPKFIIPYKDYYCSDKVYDDILDNLCDEPYVIIGNKTAHHLTDYEKNGVKRIVALGCSPFTAKDAFIREHPKFEEHRSLVD